MCDEESERVREQGQQRHDSLLVSDRGRTAISDTVVATIVGMAAQEVEGVHMGGGVARTAGGVLESLTGSESKTSGISVEVGRTETAIDLKMGIEYNKNILQTVEEVRRRITDRVQNMTGLRIKELNATITDITFLEKEEGSRVGSRSTMRERDVSTDETATAQPATLGSEPSEDRAAHNPRYEQSITVVTLFFAALLGFGLNHLLETEHIEKGSIIADHRWGFFFVAVFIFLRFLTGSANHLWLEYVSDPRDDRLKMDDVLFTWDLAWLTLLGCLGVAMCYSKEGYTFFIYTALLLFAALIWSILDWDFRRRQWRRGIGDWAPTWILLNAIQLGFVLCGLLAGYLESLGPGLLGSWLTALAMDRALGLWLLIVGFVSAVILAIDFYQQLRHLAEPPPPSPS